MSLAPTWRQWFLGFAFVGLGMVVFPTQRMGAQVVGDDPVAAIRAVLDRQEADWNRGDLEAFLTGYWKSPRVVFQSGGERHDGWESMAQRYRQRYKAEGKTMGRLSFSSVEIEILGPEAAFVRGGWRLTMPDGSKPGGLFTLIFRKIQGDWKIVHDHTSAEVPSKPRSSPTADQPAARRDANSVLAHQQMLENLQKGHIDVYFTGDSITRRWRATDYPQFLANWNENFFGWNAANFGWGGDTIQNIRWRLRNGELDGVHPRVIVLLAGTNNLGRVPASDNEVAEITRGIKALLDTMRKKAPRATIIVMGIFPRNDRVPPTAVIPSINSINANLARLGDGKTIRYLNINDKLADQHGRLFEGVTVDRLHLSLKGYQIWADALNPLLIELLGPPAREDHAPPPTGDPSRTGK
jgi:lysophospholipase L1-like esterase/ketosteroid isomerase-like protein